MYRGLTHYNLLSFQDLTFWSVAALTSALGGGCKPGGVPPSTNKKYTTGVI